MRSFDLSNPTVSRALVTNEDDEVIAGDIFNLQYLADVARSNNGTPSIPEGDYYVAPLTQSTFTLRNIATGEAVFRRQLPGAPSPGSFPFQFLTLTLDIKTHHMLSAITYSNRDELSEYYSKVQYAFGNIKFGGAVNDADVVDGEYEIISPLPPVAVPAIDTLKDMPAEVEQIRVQSDYGMCGLFVEGDLIGGHKSVFSKNFEVFSLQNDPDVYEVYYDSKWIALKEATWRSAGIDAAAVTDEMALLYLAHTAQVADVRFYFRFAKDISGSGSTDKSSGLPDILSDCRHFGYCGTKNARMSIDNPVTMGCAIGVWAKSGAQLSVKNGRSELGGQALRSEGFSGIGTSGGAQPVLAGFEVLGVRRPADIPAYHVNDENLITRVINSSINTISGNNINLKEPFDPRSLYPYTLRPGTAIWVKDKATGQAHKATLANPAINSAGTQIKLESADNGISSLSPANISSPYVRRFVDPRSENHRDYALWIKKHSAKSSGSVPRLCDSLR